jgi:5-methylcytosine-specific restriction protein A
MRGLTPDQLEQQLLADEAIIAAARARQMATLALADRMQLPLADGCRTLKEWAAGRLDISSDTAYVLTATARRLSNAPDIAEPLARGEISFDRAEAMSRIPAEHRDDWLLGVDIQGLRRIAARHRRLSRSDDHDSHAAMDLNLQPNLDESRWSVWGELDGYSGPVVNKVLTEKADTIGPLPDGMRPGLGYRRAAALTALCEETSSSSISTPLITVFVDDKGMEVSPGTPVGPEVLDKVACAGSLEVIKTGDGRPLAVGRRSRVIPNRLRRFVLHRDGGCSADNCTSLYRLEVHHVIPWSEGGPTDPENLATLCWFHHHVVVHGFGYRIDPTLGPGRLRFVKPSDHDPFVRPSAHDPPGDSEDGPGLP